MKTTNLVKKILFFVASAMLLASCVTTKVGEKSESKSATIKNEKKTPQVLFAEKLQKTLETGTIEDALLLFDDANGKLKDDYEMNLLHASLLVSANRLDEAEQIAKNLSETNPEKADGLVIQMLVAKSKGDTKTKTQLLKRIVEIDPKNSDAYVEMANDQMFRKKYKLAGNYYLKAAECDPYNTTALIGYGQCAYYQGKFKEAKIALNKALSIQPKNSMAWSYLAKLDAEDENYAAATENIQKAIEYDGFYQDYWIDYGRYMYYQGKFKAAENCWNKAASLDDTNFLVYVYRSSLYDEQGRYQQAIQDYKHIVSIKPEYYYAYEALGILYWHENNWAESRNNFLKAHEYAKDNISYSLMVSACLIKEKQIEANKKFLSNVLKNRDQNSTEYNILRLYYDGMNPQIASTKVQNETNSTLRGKCLFYLGLFYDLYGDDLNAKNYYNAVTNMQAPMFFEYRIAEWSLGSKK